RLGGSALAQVFGQIGNESPDVEDPILLANIFKAIQEMIKRNLILSGHDRSDGGLITTLVEMALAGNCGAKITLYAIKKQSLIARLFSEELGLLLEYLPENESSICSILKKFNIPSMVLGATQKEQRLTIHHDDQALLDIPTSTLLNWWESTSDRLEEQQMLPVLAKKQSRIHDRVNPSYQLTFHPANTSLKILSETMKPKVAIIREEGSNGDREMTSAFYAAGFEPWDVTMIDLLNERITLSQFRGLAFVGGFSYADVLDSAKGWAGTIKFNLQLRKMFDRFYERTDTFSLGVCNGCQLMALLGWVPWKGISGTEQPRFIRNSSGRFESRWITVKILESPSVMLKNMAGSNLGIWVAHGEGRLYCPNPEILSEASSRNLTPIVYIDDKNMPTEQYPFNPNGSSLGVTAFCSPDGRHLAMMPHPERVFRLWQWPWIPEEWKSSLHVSPWLQMFQNARIWCENK
ncbi:phosphoribosylformylglycinamidine synthase subunit PurQ, partial [bacterium]|nr:phosphoribosylformylglycinamidine synthase subunit PurQ [bacterium]